MEGKVFKKADLGQFVKDHKKELITGAISLVIIGGVVYVSYKAGVKAATPVVGQNAQMDFNWTPENNLGIATAFKTGSGSLEVHSRMTGEDAVQLATAILKKAGKLKEVVDVGENIMEVAANG